MTNPNEIEMHIKMKRGKHNRYVLSLSPESNLDMFFGRSSDSFCFNAFPSI
jgi:hypothetical protein